MALRKITLAKLFSLARKDKELFNAVLRNPAKALEQRGFVLSPGDLKDLEQSLKKVYKISGKRLAAIMTQHARMTGPPWPMKMVRYRNQWPI